MDPIAETIKTYDQIAEEYCRITEEEGDRKFQIQMIDNTLQKINFHKKPRVIDIGCGDGRDTKYLKEKDIDAVGIDLSQGMIDLGRKKYSECALIQMDMRDTVFPDDTFHGAWASSSLTNLPKSELSSVEKEVYRILEPGGIFCFSFKVGDKEGFEESVLEGHERYQTYYTLDELKTELGLFQIIETKKYPGEIFGSEFIYTWARSRK